MPLTLFETVAAIRSPGGTIRLVDGNRLAIESPADLPPTVWEAVAHHRAALVALAGGDPGDTLPDEPWLERIARPPEGDGLPSGLPVDRCDRCGSAETIASLIHDGRSIRHDCARCGRFRTFAKWRGVASPEEASREAERGALLALARRDRNR